MSNISLWTWEKWWVKQDLNVKTTNLNADVFLSKSRLTHQFYRFCSYGWHNGSETLQLHKSCIHYVSKWCIGILHNFENIDNLLHCTFWDTMYIKASVDISLWSVEVGCKMFSSQNRKAEKKCWFLLQLVIFLYWDEENYTALQEFNKYIFPQDDLDLLFTWK